MRKKRIMVIGPKGCGKTTLVNSINDYDGPLRRTQDTIYGLETIDVPSAYIENAWMYKHMIALAQDAWCILLLIDQSRTAEVYSHGFARAFHCPVIGVISKCDLMPENREICERQGTVACGSEKCLFYCDLYWTGTVKYCNIRKRNSNAGGKVYGNQNCAGRRRPISFRYL